MIPEGRMQEASTSALKSLPVSSRPAYAASVCVDRLRAAAESCEKALAPSILRRLMGGTSRDHQRSVVAAALEDARALRAVLAQARASAASSGSGQAGALAGAIDRVLAAADSWRDAAAEFQEAVYGSDGELLRTARRLATLCREIKTPASGMA